MAKRTRTKRTKKPKNRKTMRGGSPNKLQEMISSRLEKLETDISSRLEKLETDISSILQILKTDMESQTNLTAQLLSLMVPFSQKLNELEQIVKPNYASGFDSQIHITD